MNDDMINFGAIPTGLMRSRDELHLRFVKRHAIAVLIAMGAGVRSCVKILLRGGKQSKYPVRVAGDGVYIAPMKRMKSSALNA